MTEPFGEIWIISINAGHKIKLSMTDSYIGQNSRTFVETFNGQKVDDSKRITYWTSYHNGNTVMGSKLSSRPTKLTFYRSLVKAVSTGPDMTVLFKTHETSYGQSGSKAIRFSFKWESVTGGASECGNELKGNHGTVTSPGYPTNYPANAQCTWSISLGDDAKETDHIVLSFKVKIT